jgi:hypothetical protein
MRAEGFLTQLVEDEDNDLPGCLMISFPQNVDLAIQATVPPNVAAGRDAHLSFRKPF